MASLVVTSMSASTRAGSSCRRRPAGAALRTRAVAVAVAGIGGQHSVDVNFRARASRGSEALMASLRPWSSQVRPLYTQERGFFLQKGREREKRWRKEETIRPSFRHRRRRRFPSSSSLTFRTSPLSLRPKSSLQQHSRAISGHPSSRSSSSSSRSSNCSVEGTAKAQRRPPLSLPPPLPF